MLIEAIIDELIALNIIDENKNKNYTKLCGGTTSELYMIDSQYVIKLNKPQILQQEANFLNYYQEIDLFPNIIYHHPDFDYIVYSYVEGNLAVPHNNKPALLMELVKKAINNYNLYPHEIGWGWSDEPSSSWRDFLCERVNEAQQTLKNYIPEIDHETILGLINKENKYEHVQPYLLHGDFGVHNFIFKPEGLSGIIDPTPVVGPPVYDLIYAFCSSPEALTWETINSAAELMNVKDPRLDEEVLIGLYLRISTCLKHHPDDFDKYLIAWDYWKKSLRKLP
jgi:fructosamine-3-kinase